MDIVGRKRELEWFAGFMQSSEAEFIAVYGRRRVGKTFLIRRFFNDTFAFYVTGVAKEDRASQLEVFHQALERYGASTLPVPSSWLEAFNALRRLIEGSTIPGKKVIFIDELPWLDTQHSGFLTALEFFWNSFASARSDVLLVVCGSATSWMINNLIHNHGGLYNRVTGRLLLQPFTLAESAEYLKAKGVVYNNYQLAENYMIMGGIPFYLKQLDKRYGFAQNIDNSCFAANGLLRDEYTELYRSLFKNPRHHMVIIEALSSAAKGLTREDLLKLSKLPDGGSLSKTLEELEQCGFIRTYTPFGAKKKGSLIQLIDFYSMFYITFIRENSNPHFWTRVLPSARHNAWAGYAFERLCANQIEGIKQVLGISGVSTSISSWRSKKDSSTDKSVQIDLLIDRDDGVINLCEMKYCNDEFVIDSAYEAELRRKRSVFIAQTKTKKAVQITLVTSYGLTRNEHSGTVQQVITIDDLLQAG
jgi:AAA+ ATPase superfamily predicted ATPase